MTDMDARKHRRLDYDGRAWCEHPDLTLYLALGNVSAGGVFIQTGANLQPGERLKLSLGQLAAEEDEIVAKLEVVWTGKGRRGHGLGCRVISFLSGEQAYQRLIAQLGA